MAQPSVLRKGYNMHTLTLVSLEIEDCTQICDYDTAEDKLVENGIKELESIEKRSIREDILLCHLWNCQNKFSRAVIRTLEEKMEPYNEQTDDPRYLEFVDMTDEARDRYENEKIVCLKDAGGVIKPAYCWRNFEICDGAVYEKNAGRLHHPMRTKKAKRMTALTDYSWKKLYPTFERFAEDCCGYYLDPRGKRYGYHTNPRSFWDWYVIGGRWPFCFLVKNSCAEYSLGELSSSDMESPEAPEGYRWCCAARKKDIEWNVCFEWRKNLATERFYAYEKAYKSGDTAEFQSYEKITERGIESFMNLLYVKDETLEQFLTRLGYYRKSKYNISAGALLLENGEYFDFYEFQDGKWNERSNWNELIEQFIDGLSDDTVIVGVDCHV